MAERTDSVGTAPQRRTRLAAPNPWPANASFEPDGLWIAGESAVGARRPVRHAVAGVRSGGPGRPAPRRATGVPEDVLRREGVLRARDAPAGRGRGARPARGERRRGRGVRARRRRADADRVPRAEQVRRRAGAGDPRRRRAGDRRRAGRAPAPRRVRGRGGHRAAVPAPREPRACGSTRTSRSPPGTSRPRSACPAAAVPGTVAAAASLAHLRFLGLHAHIGSQVPTAEPFMRELDVLVALTARLREEHGIAVEMLDMGGGFAHHVHRRADALRRGHRRRRRAATAGPVRRARPPGAHARGRARPEHRRERRRSRSTGSATGGRSATAEP